MTATKKDWLNNFVFYFYGLFLFSSTFSISISQISLGAALVGFIIISLLQKKSPYEPGLKYLYLAIGLYLVWNIIAAVANSTPSQSLFILKEEWLFLAIPVGIHLMKQRFYRGALLMMLSAGMILISVYAIGQHYTGWHWFRSWPPPLATDQSYYASGGFHHYLTFGNYFAVAACFLLALTLLQKEKFARGINLLLLSAGVLGTLSAVLSYSRMAIAALPLPLLFVAFLNGRKWMFGAILTVLAIVTVAMAGFGEISLKFNEGLYDDLSGNNQSSRFFIWDRSLTIVKNNLLFGVGQGNFESSYQKLLDPEKNETIRRAHAHNDILDKAAVTGIPGAIFYLAIWVALFWYLHNAWYHSRLSLGNRIFCGAAMAGAIAFFMTSLSEATFSDEEVRQLLMFVWAAGLWPLVKEIPDSQNPAEETS